MNSDRDFRLESKKNNAEDSYVQGDVFGSGYDDNAPDFIDDIPVSSPDDLAIADFISDSDSDNPFDEIRRKGVLGIISERTFLEETKKQISNDIDHFGSDLPDILNEIDVIDGAIFALLSAAQGAPRLYDRYARITKRCLVERGISEQNIDNAIEYYRRVYINQTPEDKNIWDYILFVSREVSTKDKVSVLPLMCGTGKSTAITKLLVKTIKRVEKAKAIKKPQTINDTSKSEELFDGLLIVTDSKERLKKLWSTNNRLEADEKEYIASHAEGWVTVMTDENSQEAENAQKTTPVLLITTQRYFSWTKDEIKEHLKWGKSHKRPLIIFDEMPYLNEVHDVSIKTLNDIDSALWLGLDNFVNDKLWCIEQWEKFRERFSQELFSLEREFKEKFYYEPSNKEITEDDERFKTVIKEHRSDLRKNYSNAYQEIYVVFSLMNSWGVFSHQNADTGAYENKITVYIDNRDKLNGLGAKVIILDGTGDVSPIYDGQDYIEIHNGLNFIRPLSYLTIKLGDYGTSRWNFNRDRNDIASHIKHYLKDDGCNLETMYYFTYKKKRSRFSDNNQHTAHFGDIKGKNEFNNATTITQVGLNSLQPSQYLAHVLARNDDLRQTLVGKSHAETEELLTQITNSETYKDFMARHILADIDQCMFRSAIRNDDNEKDVTYYLFYKWSSGYYQLLNRKVYERYQSFFKARILKVENEEIEEAWMRHSDNARAKIAVWMNETWDGMPKKKQKVLEEINLKESTFDSTVKRHFEKEFTEFKKTAKSLGCPNGYYAKVAQNDSLYICERLINGKQCKNCALKKSIL